MIRNFRSQAKQIHPAVLFFAGAAFIFSIESWHVINQWDLEVYYQAAQDVWAGENPYYDPDEHPDENLTILTVYVYPPLFARVISNLHALSEDQFRFLWLVFQSIAFESLYWFGLNLFGRRASLVSWAAFHAIGAFYDGAETDFRAGNTALMEAAVLTAWGAYRLRTMAAGTWLGILFAVKPLTVFVSIWDIVLKRWRAVLPVVLTAGGLYLLMFLDRPLWPLYREFLDSSTFREIMEEHTAGIYNNATVSVAFRLFSDKTLFVPIWDFPPLAYALTFIVPLGLWLATFSVWRKLREQGIPENIRNGCGFALLLPTVLMTTPRVADYTLVWLLVPFFFESWRSYSENRLTSLFLYLLAGLMSSLPITGGQLDELKFELHLLHFRYLSLVLFWIAAYVTARRECRVGLPNRPQTT